ncbi:MAG: hypothetical protein J3K34DRAFT_460906 [Monoraphidium minutum]|nr:MAG: hypothetical protein J3K34DRAFT_460906 [Monoraphidium minutum]
MAGGALTPREAVMQYVCPSLGCLLLLLLYISPLPAVLEVRRRRYIGDVNALPFAILGSNALGWLFYGFLIRDWFIYTPNMLGFLAGWWYALTCYKFSKDAAQDALAGVILGTGVLFFAVGAAHRGLDAGPQLARTLWGGTAVGVLGLFYLAPLTTMLRVLRDRDSASLNGLLCATNVLNGAAWGAYGLATNDLFLALPNAAGGAINAACLALCFIFPKRRSPKDALQDLPAAAAAAGPMLRLQSAHYGPPPPRAVDNAGLAAPPRARGAGPFLDLTRMKWRSAESFVARSGGDSVTMASRCGSAAAAAAAAGDAGPAAQPGGGAVAWCGSPGRSLMARAGAAHAASGGGGGGCCCGCPGCCCGGGDVESQLAGGAASAPCEAAHPAGSDDSGCGGRDQGCVDGCSGSPEFGDGAASKEAPHGMKPPLLVLT